MENQTISDSGIQTIPIDSIQITNNIRKFYNEESLLELASSISEIGVLQLILVRPAKDGKYDLIVGTRRYRAIKESKKQSVQVYVLNNIDDRRALEMALSENIQRESLTPYEEALAIFKLIEEHHATMKEISKKIGMSQLAIERRLKLLSLPKEVQELIGSKQIGLSHVDALVKLHSEEEQTRYAKDAASNALSPEELTTMIYEDSGTDPTIRRDSTKWNGKRTALRIKLFTKLISDITPLVLQMKKSEIREVILALEDMEAMAVKTLAMLEDKC